MCVIKCPDVGTSLRKTRSERLENHENNTIGLSLPPFGA